VKFLRFLLIGKNFHVFRIIHIQLCQMYGFCF